MGRVLATAGVILWSTVSATAQGWENERAVTQDPVFQFQTHITIAPDDTAYVLWPDWTDFEDTRVMLTWSTDRGRNWTDPAVIFGGLDPNSCDPNDPNGCDPNSGTAYDNMALQADAAGLHLLLVEFLEDDAGEQKLLNYARSADGGASFGALQPVGSRTNIEAIQLFTDEDYVYVYGQDVDPNLGVSAEYLYRSDDHGATWDEFDLLPGLTVQNPHFLVHDGIVHLVFGGFFGGEGIHYTRSDDHGTSWSAPVQVADGAGPHAQLPRIAVDGSGLHVVWEDDRTGRFNVVYSRSTDGGVNWSDDVQLNVTEYGARPQLLADEQGLHLLWCQYHGDDGWPANWSSGDFGIIWYRGSTDSGGTWSDEFRVSQNEAIDPMDLPDLGANRVRVAEYTTGFAALWQDKRDGNFDLYMRNNTGIPCPDLDDDGMVGLSDLSVLLANFGSPGGFGQGDIDGDGEVNLTDLSLLLAVYGSSCN